MNDDPPPSAQPFEPVGDQTADSNASHSIVQAMFQGPLPLSAEFARYEQTTPGAGDRILSMAEAEQRQRHALAQKKLDLLAEDKKANRAQIRRGQWYGLIVSLSAIIAGAAIAIVASIYDSTAGVIMGGVVGSGGLASIIMAFTVPAEREKIDPAESNTAQKT